jgi:regulator of ribonuclease activity A
MFSGKLRTIKDLGDNILLRPVLETKSEGKALVVDGSGYLGSALMGSTLAELGLKNGWVGAVIFGAIRDVNALLTLSFGIKSSGSNPRKSEKHGQARPASSCHSAVQLLFRTNGFTAITTEYWYL